MGLEREEFAAEVEDVFGILIPGEDAARMATPRDLVRFIRDQMPAAKRLPEAEIEEAVLRLLAEHAYRARALTLDTHFRDIFP